MGGAQKLSGVLFQNGTENAMMKCSAASSWFLRATGGFRRQLLREMLSAQKAGQVLREMQLKWLQESVRAAVLCISHDSTLLVSRGHTPFGVWPCETTTLYGCPPTRSTPTKSTPMRSSQLPTRSTPTRSTSHEINSCIYIDSDPVTFH